MNIDDLENLSVGDGGIYYTFRPVYGPNGEVEVQAPGLVRDSLFQWCRQLGINIGNEHPDEILFDQFERIVNFVVQDSKSELIINVSSRPSGGYSISYTFPNLGKSIGELTDLLSIELTSEEDISILAYLEKKHRRTDIVEGYRGSKLFRSNVGEPDSILVQIANLDESNSSITINSVKYLSSIAKVS
jgi:hypothetical protein